ncbi:hypothetical protein K450DRAFT_230292 [Umbelopsis ramanniana AG]|uniref:AAA+ ATPase domain-containing protein n=1 Tax=Umbelopsis ramanniana AG TaxID=1314678 RepID=A0AAD5EEH6_UMBRA|nr:uncharacterized protein K450DRAFT_230292 [Umbelopsis ramanniana AG]KAI8581994.1 hypothetical protein K450DRAFT_230292 [Umbelopsis ramanniana AG]
MNKNLTNLWNLSKAQAQSAPESSNVPEAVQENENVDTAASATTVDQEVKVKKRSKSSLSGSSKRVRTESKSSGPPPPPSKRLSDLGGIETCIEEVMELIAMPLAHPEVYIHTGVQPPRGILLHGPPGCGKTMLAHAIAGEMGVPFYNISAPSIVSGMSGESEKKIRDVFEEAKDNAPCLLFIDEIDAITPKRETAQREMERRIVAQLLTCMDDLSWDKTGNKPVMIIGATNRPDSLDPALRRAGRFDKEISLGVPDERAREKILSVLSEKLRLEGEFDFAALAKATPGYVGADLQALITAAGIIAVKRIFKHLQTIPVVVPKLISETESTEPATENMDVDSTIDQAEVVEETSKIPVQTTSVEEFESQTPLEQLRNISEFIKSHKTPLTPEQLESLAITNDDFNLALLKVQPSSKREGFATVPDVNWDDIGALGFVRDELRMAVVEPINHPEFFERVGITAPAGVLLWGPPGCGKTLLAKAVANESNTNFISVKGPELLNKYVGESERGVRQVFARARASAPCVIFFDELDALCSRRDDQQSDASARVVNTLLTELDGAENRSQVYVIAATNRPDMIDPAMLRPGRLDKLLYVELPTAGERHDILKKLTKKSPLIEGLSLAALANDHRCEGFSGADLASLVREAAVAALRKTFYLHSTTLSEEHKNSQIEIFITLEDFNTAFEKVSPSVSKQDKRHYDALRVKLGCPMPTAAQQAKSAVASD